MHLPQVHYLAVLAAGFAIFFLGGLWYSPVLFAKRWMSLQGVTEEELKAKSQGSAPILYLQALISGLVVAWAMAVMLNHFANLTLLRAALVGVLCWIGFAASTSYATAIFSQKSKGLWLIDSGFNLVSFIIAGIILAAWR
ncbi:MAG: DUF1761 domain-containing protein [Holophagaceae bacterium]|nr:DUF1761 domain-containing protein [Holophagaceae bacterium]